MLSLVPLTNSLALKNITQLECTFAVKETIQYYKNKNSNVHVMLLDASQAFDRINYVTLFRILIKKGLCPVATRILINIYTHQTMCIKWQNFCTSQFTVSNGVKQEGVISPTLFTKYLDELIEQFKQSKIGCHIGHVFCGAFGYADDLILLAPTKNTLDKMLHIANTFAYQFSIIFNASKCKYLVFGACADLLNNCIKFNMTNIYSSNYEIHLGNPLYNGDDDRCISDAINTLYHKLNSLLSKFYFASHDVKYHLFKSYCMAVYGSQLWNYESKTVNKFYTAWRKCCRRLFNLPPRTHSALLHLLCSDDNIDVQLHKILLKFINKCYNSNNKVMRLCSQLAINGSRSDMSNSLNVICNKYNVSKDDICIGTSLSHIIEPSQQSIQNACLIKEFIAMRDSVYTTVQDRKNVECIICYLCTYDIDI